MKSILSALFLLFCCLSLQSFAAQKTDTVKVLGNCESCKARIEKAAKQAGATIANWNEETQVLNIVYDDANTSLLKIEKQIAMVGHDTRDVKATYEAYDKLHSCCKYDRSGGTTAKVCDENEEKTKN